MPITSVIADPATLYEWQSTADGSRFGFTGERVESEAPAAPSPPSG